MILLVSYCEFSFCEQLKFEGKIFLLLVFATTVYNGLPFFHICLCQFVWQPNTLLFINLHTSELFEATQRYDINETVIRW